VSERADDGFGAAVGGVALAVTLALAGRGAATLGCGAGAGAATGALGGGVTRGDDAALAGLGADLSDRIAASYDGSLDARSSSARSLSARNGASPADPGVRAPLLARSTALAVAAGIR
jgi:hypothetical protein